MIYIFTLVLSKLPSNITNIIQLIIVLIYLYYNMTLDDVLLGF